MKHYTTFSLAKFLSVTAIACISSCTPKPQIVMPPVQVNTAVAIQKDVPIHEEFVAQVYGASDVDIRARVEGWVTSMNFKEGSSVKKGTLLYVIDDIEYKNQVDRQTSEVAKAVTEMVRAENELNRVKPLTELNALSQKDLDNAQARFDASIAEVKASEASLQNAKVELGYTRVYAPFDGLIGISNVRVGDYVSKIGTSSVLATISSIGEVRIRFQLNEREILRISRMSAEERAERKEKLNLVLADGSIYEHEGSVNFADREIDPKTGTMTIEALFPNPIGILRPGQFVKIRLLMETYPAAVIVPQRAVFQLQNLAQVYIVTDSSTLKAISVEPGPKSGDAWVIKKGLKAGDRVAVVGSQSLTLNAKIEVIEMKWPADAVQQ